jgi:tetratricopeptide (TPR) repeat protein
MANMYYTDYVIRDLPGREARLKEALASLQLAEQHLPNDWANTCDLGSLELRRAILARDREPRDLQAADEHFVEAKKRLTRVIDELRPGYGFALYELAIVHRVWGKWDEARAYLEKAANVPPDYRDIADEEVEEQRRRTTEQDQSFP